MTFLCSYFSEALCEGREVLEKISMPKYFRDEGFHNFMLKVEYTSELSYFRENQSY